MLESGLEDEGPSEEFHSCTLQINLENRQLSHTSLNSQSFDNNNIDDNGNNSNHKTKWSVDLITPITSIPNKVSETLFSRKKTETANVKNTVIQSTICLNEDPQNYFTFRENVIVEALNECKDEFLDEIADGPLIEAFLLTMISNWNSDKERLILLTTKTLVIVKYDFIALKRLGYKKIPLEKIDEVIIGDLVYPTVSLIPHIDGFIDIVESCLFSKWLKTNKYHQPRNRNMRGIRLVWNQGKLNFSTQWNPFNDDLPFCTLTYHPLYFHNDVIDKDVRNLYNLEVFIEKLRQLLNDLPNFNQKIQEKSIILQNYVGIGSIIHNRNSLGFFKVRGRFSF